MAKPFLLRPRNRIVQAAGMIYHVRAGERDLGTLPLEELRSRRETGELSGDEIVWCEGMPEWATLDSVLAPGAPGDTQPPPLPVAAAPPKKKANRAALWATVGCVVVLGLCLAGFATMRLLRRAQELREQFSSSDGVGAASKPLAAGIKSLTETDVRKRSREFRVRLWQEAYKELGDHSARWDDLASGMINAWIENNFGTALTNGPSVDEMCDLLAGSSGCDDPLVLAVTGLNATDVHEKVQRLERAMSKFPASRYKSYPRFSALVGLLTEAGDDKERFNNFYRMAVGTLERCFQDGSFRPEDQAEIAEILVNGWAKTLLSRSRQGLHASARRAGPTFEWLALVLEGEFHIDQAWRARGGGYANTVSEEAWKGFALELTMARTNLTRAWKLRPDLPLAPCRMMTVALGSSDATEMRQWFDRALAAQIDYPKAWSEMRWGLHPRWHGSLEAMLALGKTAVDTKRFDTDVPRKFIDVVNDLESELKVAHGEHIFGREDIWPSFQQMYEGYISESSQQSLQSGWRSTYAVVACFAGKYDVARTQLEAMDWQPWPRQLCNWGFDFSLMPVEVAARTGVLASQVAEAEASYQREDVEDAFRRYQELKGAGNADDRTRKFIGHRFATLELEKKLKGGGWVDLLPQQDDDPAWEFSYGKVHRLSDGALEVESDKFGHLLYSRARLGENFEVQGEFEIVKTSTGSYQAGLVMGVPNINDTDWYGFRMKNNTVEGQVVSFAQGWSAWRITKPATFNEKHNSFRFRFQNGQASASVNGKEVLPATEPTRAMRIAAKSFMVGLGAYNDMNSTTLRYQKIQIRRL